MMRGQPVYALIWGNRRKWVPRLNGGIEKWGGMEEIAKRIPDLNILYRGKVIRHLLWQRHDSG
ncbi:hypothetical protein OS31_21880 [Dickeya oryzae]